MVRQMSNAASFGASLRWAVDRTIHVLKYEGVGSLARRIKNVFRRVWADGTQILPTASRPLHEQYRVWLDQHATPAALITKGCDRAVRQKTPLISVVVISLGRQSRSVLATIESLQQQRYLNWELLIVCSSAVAEAELPLRDDFSDSGGQIVRFVTVGEETHDHMARGVFAASGEFVWCMRGGDRLVPHALSSLVEVLNEKPDADLLYCDEDRVSGEEEAWVVPFFKPSWSPELLLSMNYLSYTAVFRRTILHGIVKSFTVASALSHYDCVLAAAEKTKNIVHIPNVLYHSSEVSTGRAADDKSALERSLRRRNMPGFVEEISRGRFRIRYQLFRSPLVSIIIPTKDRTAFLKRCLSSIERNTSYTPYEIVVLDNGSASEDMLRYLEDVGRTWRVVVCPGRFNFSLLNNRGAAEASGEYLLFLNDDTEIVTKDWLAVMIEQATRPGVGAVGAKLLYPDGSIQHAGVTLGVRGVAAHAFRHTPNEEWGYHGFAHLTRNCSAVTAACMLVPRSVFDEIGGFDEGFPVEFNDVDLCLRIERKGYRIVYAPDAVLYHYESATRRGTRCLADEARAAKIWERVIRQGDPYYPQSLTHSREDWSLDI